MDNFIAGLPKLELHLHIEGSLEPELMFALGQRNGVALPWPDVASVRAAYEFDCLQSFLDLYYLGPACSSPSRISSTSPGPIWNAAPPTRWCTWRSSSTPDPHRPRRALRHRAGRHRAGVADRGESVWHQLAAHHELLAPPERRGCLCHVGAGYSLPVAHSRHRPRLGERGNPPSKFARVFARCRELGLPVVAHAGEEGPAQYIWQAIRELEVRRIDHGVRCVDDPDLLRYLADTRLPLTVCPLSNTRLKVFDKMAHHNVLALLEQGLCVTINSDDPAYFGGYMNANFHAWPMSWGPA